MVHNTPVDLFRYPHIKAAVAGFHVEGGNLAALGWNHRHAAVGIAEHQQGFRLNFRQHFVYRNNHIADGFGTAGTSRTQEVVRLADAQVLEEDFIQLEIVVLAGVHQNMLAVLIQFGHYPRQTNNLRPGADHGHYFQFFHGSSRFVQASVPTGHAKVSGLSRSKISLAQSMHTSSSSPTLVMSWVQPGTVSTISGLAPSVNNS